MNNLLKYKYFENTSSTGGPNVSSTTPLSIGTSLSDGMGPVKSPQPASLPGKTTGMNYDGSEGSGDINVPYNAMGGNMVHQKIPYKGKKKRKINFNKLKKDFEKEYNKGNKKDAKVLNFNDYIKNNINKIKK